jgi:nucleotide-binding universal stress UspA family protein
MSIRTIVCPIDFSQTSYAALDVAASLARDCKATLVVAHCEDIPLGGVNSYGVTMPDTKEMQADLDQAISEVEGVHCEKRLVRGDPLHGIIGLAEKESADLIVIGTHGRTGLRRVLMGSVAESVVRHAKCPVLTVRPAARFEGHK